MKKIISLLLTLSTLTLALFSVSCQKTDDTVINIGVMSGPTGMGMAKLMADNAGSDEKYNFTVYSSPNDATPALANGTLDMLCLPTNTAATLASKQSDFISVIAINTLGSLFVLTDENTTVNSIADLEGKTIYASVPNSTTGPIINYILEQNGVNATVEFEANHDALVAKVVKNEAPIVILPEPKVSAALMQNTGYSIDLNLSTEWDVISHSPMAMGCIVVRNDFLKEHKIAVDSFLNDYEQSINYISATENRDYAAEMIYNAEVLPKLAIAKNALKNLAGSIVFIKGESMKAALEAFYAAIGQAAPSGDFYYE